MDKSNKPIDIIEVRSDLGASCRGSELGAQTIVYAGLLETIRDLGYNIAGHDHIKLSQNNNYECGSPNLKNLSAVNEINAKLYKRVSECLQNDRFPITLGGDHSIAAGSVLAVQKHYGKIGLIWVDAHGDFNTVKSSPSGNIHGMPLSALTGNGPNEILPFKEEGTEFISAKNTVIIAARALDAEEKRRIKEAGITIFSMEEIDRCGIYEITKKAASIASSGTSGIYLSFDLDACDPSVAPGVGTPVCGGLTYRESNFLCEYIAADSNLLGLEIVELNPLFDIKNQSGRFAVEIVASLLGKTIF